LFWVLPFYLRRLLGDPFSFIFPFSPFFFVPSVRRPRGGLVKIVLVFFPTFRFAFPSFFLLLAWSMIPGKWFFVGVGPRGPLHRGARLQCRPFSSVTKGQSIFSFQRVPFPSPCICLAFFLGLPMVGFWLCKYVYWSNFFL